jgi:type IV secretion system protein VirD4
MELFALTRWHRGLFTRVVHFSPTESTSDCFNPLDAIRRDPEHMLRDTQLLAQMLVNPDGNEPLAGTTRHFHLLASELLAGLIVYGLETGMATTLGAVNRVLTLGRPWTELLKELEQCPQAAVQRAAHVAGDIVDRELSGLLSTTRNALQLWTDPLVDRATSRSDFQLSDLRDGIQPMTLYLSVPFSDQERLRPLSRLLVRQVIDASTQHLTGWRHRLLLLIDEVPALRHMPILAEGLDYLRGYGVKLDLVTQSLKPFEAYGARNNFWEGAHIRLIFPPNSGTLSRLMSAETGEQTITKTRRSYQESIFWRPGTISTEPTTEPLLTATELQQLKPDEILLLAGKQRVVLQQAKYY